MGVSHLMLCAGVCAIMALVPSAAAVDVDTAATGDSAAKALLQEENAKWAADAAAREAAETPQKADDVAASAAATDPIADALVVQVTPKKVAQAAPAVQLNQNSSPEETKPPASKFLQRGAKKGNHLLVERPPKRTKRAGKMQTPEQKAKHVQMSLQSYVKARKAWLNTTFTQDDTGLDNTLFGRAGTTTVRNPCVRDDNAHETMPGGNPGAAGGGYCSDPQIDGHSICVDELDDSYCGNEKETWNAPNIAGQDNWCKEYVGGRFCVDIWWWSRYVYAHETCSGSGQVWWEGIDHRGVCEYLEHLDQFWAAEQTETAGGYANDPYTGQPSFPDGFTYAKAKGCLQCDTAGKLTADAADLDWATMEYLGVGGVPDPETQPDLLAKAIQGECGKIIVWDTQNNVEVFREVEGGDPISPVTEIDGVEATSVGANIVQLSVSNCLDLCEYKMTCAAALITGTDSDDEDAPVGGECLHYMLSDQHYQETGCQDWNNVGCPAPWDTPVFDEQGYHELRCADHPSRPSTGKGFRRTSIRVSEDCHVSPTFPLVEACKCVNPVALTAAEIAAGKMDEQCTVGQYCFDGICHDAAAPEAGCVEDPLKPQAAECKCLQWSEQSWLFAENTCLPGQYCYANQVYDAPQCPTATCMDQTIGPNGCGTEKDATGQAPSEGGLHGKITEDCKCLAYDAAAGITYTDCIFAQAVPKYCYEGACTEYV